MFLVLSSPTATCICTRHKRGTAPNSAYATAWHAVISKLALFHVEMYNESFFTILQTIYQRFLRFVSCTTTMKAKTDERGASRTRITAEIKRYHCLRSLDDYIREQKSGSTPGSGKLIEICKIIQRKLEQQPAVMNEMNNPADGMKTMWVYNTFDGCMKRWTMEGVTTLIRSMLLAEVGSSMFDTKGALQHHPELAAQLPPQFTPDEVKAVEKRLKLERSQIQAPAAARKGSRTKRFRSLERRRDTSGQADSTSSSAKRQSRDGRPGKFISTGGQGVEFTKSYGEQELNGSNKDDDNMEGKDNDSDDNDDNDYNPNDDKNGVDKGHRNNDGANRQKRRCFIYSLRTHDSTQPGNGLESVAHSRQTSVQHSRSVHQSGEDTDDEVSMVKGTWPHRALESATTASEEVEQLGARWPHRSRARLENSGEGCFARDVGAGGTSERGEAAQDLLAKKVGMEGLTTKPKDAGHRPDQSSSNLSLARRMPAAPPSPEKPLWDFEAFQSDSLFFANSHSWRCNVDRTQLDKAFNSAQQNWLEAATCLFRPLQPTIRDSKDSRRLLMFVACRLKDATESLIRGGDGGAIEKVVQWNEPSLDLEYGVAAIIGAFAIHEVFKDPTVTFGVDEHVPHIDRIIRNELSDPRCEYYSHARQRVSII